MKKSHKVLISEALIHSRVRALARQIDRHYRGKEIVLIGILNGSIIFLSDLVRSLKTPLLMDCLGASSYGMGHKSSGKVIFNSQLKLSVKNAHVLLVDDILDTGLTIVQLMKFLRSLKPASLEVCVFLKKDIPRKTKLKPRFVGFEIPNQFVYGYGLDLSERCRNLSFIAVQE